MIHVPMEPKTKANLAPDTLTTEMDEAEIKNGLQTMLQKFKNVRGINNHMGSQFTEDKRRMNYVMDVCAIIICFSGFQDVGSIGRPQCCP